MGIRREKGCIGWVYLVLALYLWIGQERLVEGLLPLEPHSCSGDTSNSLLLQKLNRTLFPEAQCLDDSDAGFYFHSVDGKSLPEDEEELRATNRSFIIWLGDTDICSGTECNDFCDQTSELCREGGDGTCNNIEVNLDSLKSEDSNTTLARCLYAAAICSSDCWEKRFPEVKAQTILCGDDPAFKEYDRVLIPSCSLDNWVGRGDDTSFGNPALPRFKGAKIFDAAIKTLIDQFDLHGAETIVLGGIRGAGAGALNLLPRLKELLAPFPLESGAERKFFTIVDSAWTVDVEKFAPTDADTKSTSLYPQDKGLKDSSRDWIENAVLLPECAAKHGPDNLHRCLNVPELLSNFVRNEPVLVLQSQYDLIQMEELGIVDETSVDRFPDVASFSQSAITYIEVYGDSVRSSIQQASRALENENVFFFSSACAQHGYIVPTRNHIIDRRTESVGEGRNTVGDLSFQRTEDVWLDVGQIEDGEKYTVREIVFNFINSSGTQITAQAGTKVLTESCGVFLCNDACKTDLTPFALTPLVPICAQQMIFVYAGFIMFVFLLLFLISLIDILKWRKVSKRYWENVRIVESGQKLILNKTSPKLRKEPSLNNFEGEIVTEMELFMEEHQTKLSDVQKQIIMQTKATAGYRSIHLMLEDVTYWPKPKFKGSTPPKILNNISVDFEPGRLHALMGPSGSGKSTLLEILGLTRNSGKLKGKHYINGVPSHAGDAKFLKEWMKQNTSYVAQQDVFFPTLTARQHLEHAAWLMLPQYMPDKAKLQRVWQFIRLMDLSFCADTICGDGGVYYPGGLSGGQRRRLSIATQMLRNPALLFLDEPTTGLDSQGSLYLLQLLHELANIGGVNVILTIHQPRKEIFKLIDNLVILVRGHLVFAGKPMDGAHFFDLDVNRSNLNIGDDILDLLKAASTEKDVDYIENLRSEFEQTPQALAQKRRRLEEKTYLTPALAAQIRTILVFNSLSEGRWSWNAPSSASWLQFVLLSRTFARGAFNIRYSILLSILSGFVLGILFFNVDDYKGVIGLVYLIVATLTFLQGIFLGRRYFDEKAMFDHEWSSGTMRSWQAFILSQYGRDAVFASAETLAFVVPAYFLGGLSSEADRIFNFFILAVLTGYCTSCQNVFIQINWKDIRTASTIQIGALAVGALFNGFIVPLETLPAYFAWIPYICLGFYGFVGVVINELANFSLPCDLGALECSTRTGDVVVRVLNYDHLDVFICTIGLMIMIIVFRVAGAISFYFRYARIVSIKRSGERDPSPLARLKSSKSVRKLKTERKKEENRKDGATIQKLLTAPTPEMMRSNLSNKSPRTTVTTPSPGEKLETRSDSLNMFHLDSSPSKTTAVEVEEDRSEFFDAKTGIDYSHTLDDDEYSEFSNDSDPEDAEHAPLSLAQKILLSREAFAIFFLIDMLSTGYVCAPIGNNGLISVAAVFLLAYFAHYCNQVMNLMPRAIDGSGNDFVWAGEYDFPSLILIIADGTLTFQAIQFQANGNIETALVVTLIVRLFRMLRVQLFWYKVNKMHKVTAVAFLEVAKILEAKRKEEEDDADDQFKPPSDNKRISWRGQMENLINKRGSDNIGRLSNRLSANLGNFTLANFHLPTGSRGSTDKDNLYANLPAPRKVGSASSTKNPKRPARPERPGRPDRPARPLRIPAGKPKRVLGPEWQEHTNPSTNKRIFFNPYTNELVDTSEYEVVRSDEESIPNSSVV